MHTGPYTAIREVEHLTDGNKEGRPSDLKYAFENPVERALLLARFQGPRPPPAVFLAPHSETPFAISAARRRRGVFHWCQPAVSVGPNCDHSRGRKRPQALWRLEDPGRHIEGEPITDGRSDGGNGLTVNRPSLRWRVRRQESRQMLTIPPSAGSSSARSAVAELSAGPRSRDHLGLSWASTGSECK